jgi:hypothetical protein
MPHQEGHTCRRMDMDHQNPILMEDESRSGWPVFKLIFRKIKRSTI